MIKKIKLFKIVNFIRRQIIKRSFDSRPASYPYITGDGLRKIADHIYDETTKCQPEAVRAGQIVFINADLLADYFSNCHPQIKYPYKLISHNSDYNIKESDLHYIDDKIIYWFAQNVMVSHPKLIPIPFGLDNLHLYYQGVPKILEGVKKIKTERKNRIIFGFSIITNPRERQPAYDYLINSKIADKLPWEDNPKKYLKLINNYQFIACPSGNGLDDPRTWQALYLGIVPITIRSVAREYFQNLKLPIFIIEKWSDLDKLTEDDLGNLYNKLTKDAEIKPLFIDYWINLIKNKK
jgi:hypothetical protein